MLIAILVLFSSGGPLESIPECEQFFVVRVDQHWHLAHTIVSPIQQILRHLLPRIFILIIYFIFLLLVNHHGAVRQIIFVFVTLALITILRILFLIFVIFFFTTLVKKWRVRVIEDVFGVGTNLGEPFKDSLRSSIFSRISVIKGPLASVILLRMFDQIIVIIADLLVIYHR